MTQRAALAAKLILEDGTVFTGKSFGNPSNCTGEVVFNTGMTGYPETLTDPSYAGQILIFTYPLIGNYGIGGPEIDENKISINFESNKIHARGVIVAEHCNEPSHWNCKKTIAEWLNENKIPGISGIDTRALTTKLREKGVMQGKIVIGNGTPTDSGSKEFGDENENLVAQVSVKEKVVYKPADSIEDKQNKNKENKNKENKKIILIDCGAKNNILRCLLKRKISVIRVPWNYDFSKEEYDGIMISNGPGDPKMCVETIKNVRMAFAGNKPIFGICLGNQIMALAAGGDTYKLKYGHRSQNQPCTEVGTKRCYITSQNHGYAVDESSLPERWEPWFRNANDNTNEGIKHKTKPFFSVQFHPEASPGPTDTEFLFDKFIGEMK